MTKIAIAPNAAGTGLFTIEAPNSNSNRTLTLPDAAGELLTDAENNPAKLFRRDNILGTVSQSAGVPTGAIIERGSNANGEFVKYADGTMICTRSITPASNNNVGTLASFAVAFSVVPNVAAQANNIASGITGGSFVTEHSSVSTTQCRVKVLSHVATDILNATNVPISIVAIGRWF
jgi:hypothetical protein